MEYDHENTMRLIKLAQEGDLVAKEKLINENTPLIKSIVKRYIGKGIEYNDLMQIASLGLLKAIYNFSQNFEVRFSTYAVPMITGEIKRFIRDDGYIKVSRSIKATSIKIYRFIDDFKKEFNTEPTLKEISEKFNIDKNEIIFIMDSAKLPISLYEKVDSSDEKGMCLMDKIPSEHKEEDLINRVILKTIINSLTSKERKIILLRYFRDYTQGDIAKLLGVSQVQVSRLENKIIKKIREKFEQT